MRSASAPTRKVIIGFLIMEKEELEAMGLEGERLLCLVAQDGEIIFPCLGGKAADLGIMSRDGMGGVLSIEKVEARYDFKGMDEIRTIMRERVN